MAAAPWYGAPGVMHPHHVAAARLLRLEHPFIAAAGGEPIAAQAPVELRAQPRVLAAPLLAEQVIGPALGLLGPLLAA